MKNRSTATDAEELVNGTDAQSGENGYYTYIYNPPAGYAWQVVALVGEEIAGGTFQRRLPPDGYCEKHRDLFHV